jgi:hypothetical protein
MEEQEREKHRVLDMVDRMGWALQGMERDIKEMNILMETAINELLVDDGDLIFRDQIKCRRMIDSIGKIEHLQSEPLNYDDFCKRMMHNS